MTGLYFVLMEHKPKHVLHQHYAPLRGCSSLAIRPVQPV